MQNGHASLSGENALQIIAQVEVIPWIFVVSPKQSLALSVQPFAPTGEVLQTCIPKRFGTLQQTELARLPRPYFQVYAYVDGKKTVEEIAQLLRTTPEHVERILSDLQAWRIVQYR